MLRKISIAFLLQFLATSAYCGTSLEGSFGMFSINGQSASGSSSVSSPGHFSFGFSFELLDRFELFASYSIMNESFISGDRAYGPNLGARYYHWGNGENFSTQASGISISSSFRFLPFFKIGFAQRQYQSIRASYSGPMVGLGVLTNSLYKDLPIFFEVTRASLGGEKQSTVDETSIMLGVQWRLP